MVNNQVENERKHPRILFFLNENMNSIFEKDKIYETGYRELPIDLPMSWGINDFRFVSLNSLTGVVSGPFWQVEPVLKLREPRPFHRKEAESINVYLVNCDYVLKFMPVGGFNISRGLSWLKASEILRIGKSFQNCRKILIPDSNFEKLCGELCRLNQDQNILGEPLKKVLTNSYVERYENLKDPFDE